MVEKCVMCEEKIIEEFGKLIGTIVNVKDEKGKRQLLYVFSSCMKKYDWVKIAKIKGVWKLRALHLEE